MNYAEMTPQEFATERKLGKAQAATQHVYRIREAIRSRSELDTAGLKGNKERQPVSVAAVDAYGIPLPAGYTKKGNLYVWKPIKK